MVKDLQWDRYNRNELIEIPNLKFDVLQDESFVVLQGLQKVVKKYTNNNFRLKPFQPFFCYEKNAKS